MTSERSDVRVIIGPVACIYSGKGSGEVLFFGLVPPSSAPVVEDLVDFLPTLALSSISTFEAEEAAAAIDLTTASS